MLLAPIYDDDKLWRIVFIYSYYDLPLEQGLEFVCLGFMAYQPL